MTEPFTGGRRTGLFLAVARGERAAHPVFFEAFCTPDPLPPMRRAITRVLAGGVEKIPISSQIWIRFMLWGIGFDRLRRQLAFGPAQPGRPSAA